MSKLTATEWNPDGTVKRYAIDGLDCAALVQRGVSKRLVKLGVNIISKQKTEEK